MKLGLRGRGLRATKIIVLLLLGAGVIVNGIGMRRLNQQLQSHTQADQTGSLSARLVQAEHRLEAFERQPAHLSQASFAAARDALESRLTEIEQAQDEHIKADEFQSLASRVEQVDDAVQKLRQSSAAESLTARRRAVEPVRPKVVEPPFKVIGVELRGGERFLSVLPNASAPFSIALAASSISVGKPGLAQVHLLRPGSAEGAWRLEAIESTVAVFRVDGQVQKLPLP